MPNGGLRKIAIYVEFRPFPLRTSTFCQRTWTFKDRCVFVVFLNYYNNVLIIFCRVLLIIITQNFTKDKDSEFPAKNEQIIALKLLIYRYTS